MSMVLFVSIFLNIVLPYSVSAGDSTSLKVMIEVERMRAKRIAQETARLDAEEARASQSKIIVTDPTIKEFAKLPFVARLRVTNRFGITDFGTGSVIRSDEGRALIVTVSHIFRNVDEKSHITAELFNPQTGTIETFAVGHEGIKKTDSKSDVGLLEIPVHRIIPVVPLASPDDTLKVGQKVMSYGCGGGEHPTSLWHKITTLNRYVGPDTIECTGVPRQGRSGGALVDGRGRLIGITVAADPRDQRGLYTGLQPIRALLISAGINPADLEKPVLQK